MALKWFVDLFTPKRETTRSRVLPGVPVHQSGQYTVVLTRAEPLRENFEPSHRTTLRSVLGAASAGRQERLKSL